MTDIDVIGSDIAEKTGWNALTMLDLYEEFIVRNGLTDKLLEFLNTLADEELSEMVEVGDVVVGHPPGKKV
jgi:hypothetical protein